MIWDLHSEEPGVCLVLTYASYGMDSGYVVAHHTRWRDTGRIGEPVMIPRSSDA